MDNVQASPDATRHHHPVSGMYSEKDEEEGESEGEGRVALTEQEVVTGEEDEETRYQVRGKLFVLTSQNQWKERGTGTLRLNVSRDGGSPARLVMRKEAVYTLLLNAVLFKGMNCSLAQDPGHCLDNRGDDALAHAAQRDVSRLAQRLDCGVVDAVALRERALERLHLTVHHARVQ